MKQRAVSASGLGFSGETCAWSQYVLVTSCSQDVLIAHTEANLQRGPNECIGDNCSPIREQLHLEKRT